MLGSLEVCADLEQADEFPQHPTPNTQSAADFETKEFQRFRDGWGMYFRATLTETTDAKLTASALETHNLYLFGDPGSNAVLRRLLPKLPLKWTQNTLTIAGKSFSAADHLPLLIFPNPEAPSHYVVIGVGFTFSNADMAGSNARQYPHLPDYAVISLGPTFTDDRTKDTVLAGFFDEQWRIPGGK